MIAVFLQAFPGSLKLASLYFLRDGLAYPTWSNEAGFV
jgi:hypothetical protein